MPERDRMRLKDVSDIAEMEKMCFAVPWSREAFLYELSNPMARYLVLREGGRVVAYAGYRYFLDEGEITNVAVHPGHRRKGLGRSVMEALLADAAGAGVTALTLEVRAHNLPAQALYRALGFEKIGVRKGYYPDNGEDAWLMRRSVGPEDAQASC